MHFTNIPKSATLAFPIFATSQNSQLCKGGIDRFWREAAKPVARFRPEADMFG